MNPARYYETGVDGITHGQGAIGFKDLIPGAIGLTVAREGFHSSFLRDTLGAAWDDTLTVLLEKDASGRAKTIAGNLRTISGKIMPYSQVLFGCRAPDDGWLFFGQASAEGAFTISGIPSACERGELLLQYSPDSMEVGLPARENQADFVVQDPPPPLRVAPKANAPSAARFQERPWFRKFTLLGRWRSR